MSALLLACSSASDPSGGAPGWSALTTIPATVSDPETSESSAPDPPAFHASFAPVSEDELGGSWTPGLGCTAAEELRTVELLHWGYDDAAHTGRIVVAADLADAVTAIFAELYEHRFPIEQMVPIAAYDGDDQASMRANNTSGYNCRTVAGTTTLSQHALGRAIDINPLVNPYVRDGSVDPPEGASFVDRSRDEPGMIHADDVVVRAFEAHGWAWGGYWASGPDYQHFSASG